MRATIARHLRAWAQRLDPIPDHTALLTDTLGLAIARANKLEGDLRELRAAQMVTRQIGGAEAFRPVILPTPAPQPAPARKQPPNPPKPDKAEAIARAVKRLNDAGYPVVQHAGGVHLQIHAELHGTVDYWPTTGKWWISKIRSRGTGLSALLRKLGADDRRRA